MLYATLHYRSQREQRDRHLSHALRIVARAAPAWGYRLAGGYLRLRGWRANVKRVYQLWRLNGLSLPPYRPKRKLRTGAQLKGFALRRNDVWAWDFVHDHYHDNELLRCLTVKDEATGYFGHKNRAHIEHQHVREVLRELISRFGCPRAIRSDNGSELLAEALRQDMQRYGIELANIKPGAPWQNGSCESFNSNLRRECLNAEVFATLTEARVVIEQWRQRYNTQRPHSSQNYITSEVAYFQRTHFRKSELNPGPTFGGIP